MNTENTIKKQAKNLLKGNWLSIIAAAITACVAYIAIDSLSSIFQLAFGVVELENFEVVESKAWLNFTILAASYVIMFFISPIINGVYKTFCDVSVKGNCCAADVFFYFRNKKKFFRTLLLNLINFGLFIILGFAFDIFQYMSLISNSILKDNPSLDVLMNVLLVFSVFISVAIKILLYFLFVHYPLMAYSFNDSLSLKKYTFSMYLFSLKNLGALIKLTFSFWGWILLCFFVVPAFYVLPYVMTSMAVSAKWLFELDKNFRGLLC